MRECACQTRTVVFFLLTSAESTGFQHDFKTILAAFPLPFAPHKTADTRTIQTVKEMRPDQRGYIVRLAPRGERSM